MMKMTSRKWEEKEGYEPEIPAHLRKEYGELSPLHNSLFDSYW